MLNNHEHRCSRGVHIIRSSRDIRSNGQCAGCSRDNEARYRARLRDARRQLLELQTAA